MYKNSLQNYSIITNTCNKTNVGIENNTYNVNLRIEILVQPVHAWKKGL